MMVTPPVENLTPGEALERIREDGRARLLDIRSERAFEAGHPRGAVHLPFSLTDRDAFVTSARERFGTDRTLVVIGERGMRSSAACRLLSEAGFTTVNVVGGVDGLPRGRLGMGQVGWRELGLPWSAE